MAIPDPATTDWVPIWSPVSQGPVGPIGPAGPVFSPVWVDVAYAAGNFGGSGGMTWTVLSAGMSTYRYIRMGEMVSFLLLLDSTSTGTPSNTLNIQLPFTATKTTLTSYPYVDSISDGTGAAQVTAGSSVLKLFKGFLGANWGIGSIVVAIQINISV